MKYLCYYDTLTYLDEERNYAPAASNKMDYIISVINELGYNVEIVSASRCLKKGKKGGNRIEGIGRNTVRLFASHGGNKFVRAFDRVQHSLHLFIWLLKNTKRGEMVICYHSLGYCWLVQLLQKIKKIELILEVEEIYADVMNDQSLREKELNYIRKACAYIFPTHMLERLINTGSKPCAVIHGTYQVEMRKYRRIDTSLVHILYAGTLDPRKGGAAAAAAAAFLPSNYIVHIIGFGSDDEVNKIKECVEELKQKNVNNIVFDGLKRGEDYVKYVQSCDIGLSTQDPNAAFNATSFPSKVLSYMANGLRVVSTDIPAIRESDVGSFLYYYQTQTPQEIANAVISVDMADEYDGRKIIEKLSEEFEKDLKDLLQKMRM